MWLLFATVLLARAADPSVGEWSWAAVPFSSASTGARKLEVIVDASQVLLGDYVLHGKGPSVRAWCRVEAPGVCVVTSVRAGPTLADAVFVEVDAARWGAQAREGQPGVELRVGARLQVTAEPTCVPHQVGDAVVSRAARAFCVSNGVDTLCEELLGPSDWMTCERDAAQLAVP